MTNVVDGLVVPAVGLAAALEGHNCVPLPSAMRARVGEEAWINTAREYT